MDHVPASRRVFEITDLLDQILQHLFSQELALMARVSRPAHQRSIKKLWGESSGWTSMLDHLVELLPGVVEVEEVGYSPNHRYTRSLTESDWTRFKHYSIYVTKIAVSPVHLPTLHLSISHLNEGYFPRLRRIYLSLCLSECATQKWFAIAGPTLQTLYIDTHYHPLASQAEILETLGIKTPYHPVASRAETLLPFNSLLQQIQLQSPSLTTLVLPKFHTNNTTLFSDERFILAFRSTLTSLKCLTHFAWPYVNIPLDVIQIIISLPQLTSIELGNVPLISPGDLPSLISLDLRNCSEKAIGSWLAGMRSLDLLTSGWFIDIKEVDATIALSGSPPPYIRSLSQALNLNDIHIRVQDPTDVSWSCFRPLLECRSMSEVHICVTGHLLSLDDDALREISMSWRKLAVFWITELSAMEGTSQDDDYQHPATLCGLGWLALSCPLLSKVTIQLSMYKVALGLEEVISQAQSKLSAPRSIYLDLGYSQFGVQDRDDYASDEVLTPQRIAQILRIFWPGLEIYNFDSEWSDANPGDEFQSLMRERYQSFKDAMTELVEEAALESLEEEQEEL